MLRLKTPFVTATVGGMIALVGDKIWLVFDTVAKPWNIVDPVIVYTVIGVTFVVGMAMMAWSIVLYRRNGYAMQEVRDELQHRRAIERKKRLARILHWRPSSAAAGSTKVQPAASSEV